MDRRAVYGPRDGTVLSQQSQHRSDEILDGNIDEVLQAKRADGKFWRNLREQDLPIRVQQILHQIGFYGVYRCGRIQYDCHLITALVERWRSETHSFHFRVGEATITLQDVQVIWGLPIDGEPVSGTDLERTSVQWQEYCMQYIGFVPEEGALKGSRLQVKAIIEHISHVHITPDTPHLTVVQYARAVALLLLGGTMCPDSSGNLVSLLYLAKLEDIVAARNYSWGSAVLAFLYRELCNASEKGKAAIGGVAVGTGAPYGAMWNCEHTFTRTVRTTVRVIRDILDEMQYDQFIWQPYDMESNVIMAYAGDFNPQLWRSICPLIFYAIVEMHHPERVLRQFGMMQNIPDQPDTRDMSLHKITRSNRTGTDWVLQHILYITRWQRRYDTVIQRQPISNRRYRSRILGMVNTLQTLFQSKPVDVEGYRQLVAQLEHEVQIIAEAIKHQPQQTATPSDSAPTTSHRQRRSSSQMSIGSVERGDIGVDIAGPSTAYTPQDYYVPQPPQDYYVPQPSQDDWFQSTSYMPSHAEAYSSHVDLDLGLGFNQPYAPEYNISPVPFPSFSAYRDNVGVQFCSIIKWVAY
ncbi:UNVERIFIED_CONTAM: Serine/threonine-protein phosphatase 7 long form [Sesamum radiatum]|uniref:Serine/threonine-protein phosphatase 7 long form n=1 Tax=Sesamum radiatum TaxID=300843 RepID=A0AAW2MZT8_SESRA